MFTSATKKSVMAYGVWAVICLLFQLIYGIFSHGVSSPFMTFAFLIPLAGGIIILLGDCLLSSRRTFHEWIAGGVIWLTLGSILQGVVEIYGTTNQYIKLFAVIGLIQIVCGLGVLLYNTAIRWGKLT